MPNSIFEIDDGDELTQQVDDRRYNLVVSIAGLESFEINDVTRDQYDSFLRTNEITDGDGTTYKFIIPSNVAGCVAISPA